MSARKSWFLLDDELVALGADIRSTAPNKTVETIIENRRVTAAATFTADPNGMWAHLGSSIPGADIGYFFPGRADCQSASEMRSGAWRDINAGGPTTVLTAEYRTLWLDHGIMPGGATYSYVLLPGKSAQETAAYAASPAVKIIENDADVQAVKHAGLGIRAANFWSVGGKSVAGISSDSVASVLVHQANGLLAIAVSDPTQANNDVMRIEIDTPASGVVSHDDGVTVERTTPTVRLAISPSQSHGKPFLVTLSL